MTVSEGDRLGVMSLHALAYYSLSYAGTIELEVRLLEKGWSGEPRLFAGARLR